MSVCVRACGARARVSVRVCACACTCVSVRVCVYVSVSERDLDSPIVSMDVDVTAAGLNRCGGGVADDGGSVGEVQLLQVTRRTVVVIAVHVDNVVCRERVREREEGRKDRTRER